MSWLSGIQHYFIGGRFPLFDVSFLVRNFARISTVFVALFAALPAMHDSGKSSEPDNVFAIISSAANALARQIEPSEAVAAPRQGERARNTRRKEKQADIATETPSEQLAPGLAPLTPYIQIWPLAHAAITSDAPAMTQMPTQELMQVADKSDRLNASPADDTNVIQADEMSELDRAATSRIEIQPDGLTESRAQRVAFATTTDGRAMHDNADLEATLNRFSTFVESVKAIPHAPGFESILIVVAGVVAAFTASRIFMRA